MRLEYSPKGTPYIILDNGLRLSFSTTTETEKGFKYLCVNGTDTKTVTINNGKTKEKITIDTSENISFVLDMNFKRDRKKGIPKDAKKLLSKITLGYLKKTFENLITTDGYFPRKNLALLDEKLKRLNNPNDILDDDLTATESFDNE